MVQFSKLPALKDGYRGIVARSGKQNVSYQLTRQDLILWGASVTER